MIARCLLAALAGAAVMALEVLSARWLAPAFGFTLSTWAVLISVTLLASSIGAALGGMWSGPKSTTRLGLVFGVAAVWTALVAVFVPAMDAWFLGLDLLVGTTLFATLVLFVPVLCLAAALPMLIVGAPGPEGRSVGLLVTASAFGSLVGTLATALVLVPRIGIHWTAIVWTVLLAAGAGGARGPRVAAIEVVVVLAIVGAIWAAVGRAHPRSTWETPYGQLTIREHGGGYVLAVNGITQAGISPLVQGRGSLIASRHYVELLPWMRPQGRRALNVGLGGGLVPTMFDAYGVETVSLEIDPGLAEVVQEHFGFDGEIRIGDGRALWRRMDERYDFVVLDAFQGEGLPAHLLTREAFVELKDRLTDRGVICVHLIGRPAHRVTASVHATLADVFYTTLVVRSGLDDELQDLFLFASDGPLVVQPAPALLQAGWIGNEIVDAGEGTVLTDDHNPLDVWNEPLARALRRASRAP